MPGLPARRPHFLKHSADIERVKQSGRRLPTSLFNLMSSASGVDQTRIGIIVGRRFGKAVKRNRVKRIFRSLARHTGSHFKAGYDVLVFPRQEALVVKHARLRDAWTAALKHEGLLTLPAEIE